MDVPLLPDLEVDEEENEPNEEVLKLRENGPRCSGLGREGCDRGEMSSGDMTKCCPCRLFSWASGEASMTGRKMGQRGEGRRTMNGENDGDTASDGNAEGNGELGAGLLRMRV